MYKKYFWVCILLFIFSTVAFAQQPVIVEAPPMIIASSLTPDEVNSVGGVFAKTLSEARNVRIINKLALDKGMRDYEFQQRDWVNVEKTIALCDVLNIDWAIRPQMQKRINRDNNTSEIILTVVLLNIRTKEIMYSTPVVLRNSAEAPNKMQAHINEITQIMTGDSVGLKQSEQSLYKVGDRGPAGGWIYYDKGNYSDGWRYLETAPRSAEASVSKTRTIKSGSEGSIGLSREIGTGKRNTELIIQSLLPDILRSNLNQDDFTIIKAARICANMELNWFKDWFLPSRSELSRLEILTNRMNNFAEFTLSYYCSSSGSEDTIGFSPPGNRGFADRNAPNFLVRAIRAF
jgi:hypothetical protein